MDRACGHPRALERSLGGFRRIVLNGVDQHPESPEHPRQGVGLAAQEAHGAVELDEGSVSVLGEQGRERTALTPGAGRDVGIRIAMYEGGRDRPFHLGPVAGHGVAFRLTDQRHRQEEVQTQPSSELGTALGGDEALLGLEVEGEHRGAVEVEVGGGGQSTGLVGEVPGLLQPLGTNPDQHVEQGELVNRSDLPQRQPVPLGDATGPGEDVLRLVEVSQARSATDHLERLAGHLRQVPGLGADEHGLSQAGGVVEVALPQGHVGDHGVNGDKEVLLHALLGQLTRTLEVTAHLRPVTAGEQDSRQAQVHRRPPGWRQPGRSRQGGEESGPHLHGPVRLGRRDEHLRERFVDLRGETRVGSCKRHCPLQRVLGGGEGTAVQGS